MKRHISPHATLPLRNSILAVLHVVIACLAATSFQSVRALDYPYATAEPQKTGWPLSEDELAYVLKPEYARRPGSEEKKHLPAMWPAVPSAGNWGGTSWLDTHAKLVKHVEQRKGPIDILLVGDSITQQWGSSLDNKPLNAAWQKHLGSYSAVNIGIGGDKTQNVLWRIDHGGVEGLQPKVVVVLIGNNNMFFAPETGVEAAAQGIKMVVANVRDKFPKAEVIAVKIFPAHAPGNAFYENIKKTNVALDALKLDSDPKVHVIDLWNEMVNANGTIKPALFGPDKIHLSQDAGYGLYAEKLKPLIEQLLSNKKDKSAAANQGAGNAVATRTLKEQYLLLNYSASLNAPNQAADMMAYVRDKFGEANKASVLKVGVAIIYTPKEQVQQHVERLKADLELAQKLNVPVLIQVDTESWLPDSLLNWHDPKKPGYDPTKIADVEWYGWTPDTAVKLCWRNWGVTVRVGPQPNLLSPRFQAWEKDIYAALAPVVVHWLKKLPAEQQWLFVGWKCGWETTPNSQYAYFKDGNSYYERTDDPKWDNSNKQHMGYNAAKTAGIQTSGVLDYEHTYDVFMKIIGRHLSYLATTARALGLPREKLFVHTIAQGVDRYNMDSQFNADSNPSPSFYGKGGTSLRTNPSFQRCVQKARAELGATGYGYGEFKLSAKDYDTWHRWFVEHLRGDSDCLFQALYNYDTMKGKPDVERAMLDAMALFPAVEPRSDSTSKSAPSTAVKPSIEYPYAPYNECKLDPQLTGWPLNEAERAWVTKGEYERKPGHDAQKHLPEMWFVTPTAGHWKPQDGSVGNAWIDHHATNIANVKAAARIDIALLGDSITQHWGGGWDGTPFNAAWQKHFGGMKTVNLGIGGDRMEHILWRLDHGALDGAMPKVIVLMIGVNNAPLVHANGVPAASAAHGIKLCVQNLRLRCPQSQIVLVKILPAFDPSKEVGKQVVNINAQIDTLKLENDSQVHVLDLWSDFTRSDGTLKSELYADKYLHLGESGYELFAAKLKPSVSAIQHK